MIENDPKKIKDKIINKLISLRDQQTTQKGSDTMSESMDENARKELKEILMSITKNEIRFFYQETKETLPVCSSKIGGKPAMPADFQWSEFMFGDCGHLYFWIRKQDLQNRDFDHVWMILQCS